MLPIGTRVQMIELPDRWGTIIEASAEHGLSPCYIIRWDDPKATDSVSHQYVSNYLDTHEMMAKLRFQDDAGRLL